MSSAELAEVHKQLNEYLEHGWIYLSMLPYGAPVLFVYKKRGYAEDVHWFQGIE